MTDATPHRATPEHWKLVQDYSESDCSPESCILELRARVEALEVDANEDSASTHFCFDSIFKRLEALEATATCPHIISSDEGTSYCRLAEQVASIGKADVPTNTSAFELSDDDQIPQKPAPNGSLMERVDQAIANAEETCTAPHWAPEARAAIRAVVEWLRENEISFYAAYCLDREVKR